MLLNRLPRVSAGGGGYSPAATAYFAAMTVQPDDTRKTLINNLITGLVSDGSWALLDLFYLIAAHDAQAANLNAKNPGGLALTPNGGLTFTADRGYLGDGTTGWLDTGFLHSALPTMTQNDMSQHFAFNVYPASVSNMLGTTAAGAPNAIQATNTLFQTVRANDGNASGWTPASMQGVHSVFRNNSATAVGYSDGVLGANITAASIATQASNVALLRSGATFAAARVSFYSIGRALSVSQVQSLAARVKTYLTALGAL